MSGHVYKIPKILVLRGVGKKDYVSPEDNLDARLQEDAEREVRPPSPLPPDAIPKVFSSIRDWPESTNLKCWQCDFTFDWRPAFVPTGVREVEGVEEYPALGNVCNWDCVVLYIHEHYPPEKAWRLKELVNMVAYKFTGVYFQEIKAAPSKTRLRQYGGDLTEDEFWALKRKLNPKLYGRDPTQQILPERERRRPWVFPAPAPVVADAVPLSPAPGAASPPASPPRGVSPAPPPPAPAAAVAPAAAGAAAAEEEDINSLLARILGEE